MGTGISPEKILVVLFVALIVLGPDKLPELARRAGKLWSDLRRYRESLESEVKGALGIEGISTIASPLRSPLSFLTDPPPATAPAGDVVASPPAGAATGGTAPVSDGAAPMVGTPVAPNASASGEPIAGGSPDDWAATVTASWDAIASPDPGPETSLVPETSPVTQAVASAAPASPGAPGPEARTHSATGAGSGPEEWGSPTTWAGPPLPPADDPSLN